MAAGARGDSRAMSGRDAWLGLGRRVDGRQASSETRPGGRGRGDGLGAPGPGPSLDSDSVMSGKWKDGRRRPEWDGSVAGA
jgi:hypothetical protein